jgi:hypothetical protein
VDFGLSKDEIIDATLVTIAGYPYADKSHFIEGLSSMLTSALKIITGDEFANLVGWEELQNAKAD